MKINRYLSLIPVIFFVLGVLGCAEKPSDIQFEKDFFELGELDEGIKTELNYTFTNTGAGTLIIKDVKPACGCIVAHDWDKEVKPGASGKIPVTFNTASYQGEIVRLIDITTNVPDKPLIQLTLKAKVRTPVVLLSPPKVWLAEVSPELKELYGTFRVTYNLEGTFKIEQVIPPEIKNTYTITAETEGKSYKLDFVIYAPFSGSGNVEYAFTLKTNLKERPEITLPFYYYIKP